MIEPRFNAIAAGDVREKSAGELVTMVDEDSERLLTAGLAAIVPGAAVVGEEACAGDPALTARLRSSVLATQIPELIRARSSHAPSAFSA